MIIWHEGGETRSARWRSEAKAPPPLRVVIADDTLTADAAYRLANAGIAMLWRGDFQNARQLLQAIARRIARKPKKKAAALTLLPADAFHRHRMAQAQRARLLGMLLLPFNADYTVPLRRSPDVRAACNEAYGAADKPCVASLRELLGLIGAHEWRSKGVVIASLGARIHPHYGVFSPVRGEYLQLIATAPLPGKQLAFDIGTGTGVIAALLSKRGIQRVIATDQDRRALNCARDNLERLGLQDQVDLLQQDMFPTGRALLVVCNPPWVPARANAPIEHAIYDPESRMLRAFLRGLADHLEPGGEGWLILSDLAEHLGLRTRVELLEWIADGGLKLIERHDIRPQHPKIGDPDDPLHTARAAEITSLWRLGSQSAH